jgi:AraC-like DNA-binding protein
MPYSRYHNYYEILYVLDGSRKIVFENGKEYILDQSSIALVQPGVMYQTLSDSPRKQSKIVIIASQLFVEELCKTFSRELFSCFDYGVITMDAETQQTVRRNLNLLRTRYNSENSFSDNHKIPFINIVYQLSHYMKNQDKGRTDIRKNLDVVYEVKKYIDVNFSQKLSLAELSKMFSVSEGHLSRKFKEKTGKSISKYIMTVRLTSARRLLESSSMSIRDIAENVGFSSLNHFDKMFKKDHGFTPSEYMKDHIAKKEKKKE